jgi:hypothetical protein
VGVPIDLEDVEEGVPLSGDEAGVASFLPRGAWSLEESGGDRGVAALGEVGEGGREEEREAQLLGLESKCVPIEKGRVAEEDRGVGDPADERGGAVAEAMGEEVEEGVGGGEEVARPCKRRGKRDELGGVGGKAGVEAGVFEEGPVEIDID